MKILGIQETDWLTRGPHTQHHVFERLSINPNIKITIFDYDIDKVMKSKSLLIKRREYLNINKAVRDSKVQVIRTSHIQIPYIRRISSLISNFFGLIKYIRKNRPDIIIGLSISNGLIGLILAKLFRIPYFFYYIDLLHTLIPLGYVQNFARIVSRFILKYSDQIIVVTNYLKEYIVNEGINENKITILLNGISLENTVVDQTKLVQIKRELAISEKDFIIFFMGYLYDFAGLKEIIDYYHMDVKQGKLNLKFVIVGDGGIYSSLKQYIHELNANWVKLTGRVPFFDITEYIALADLCLMSFKLNEITRQITPVKVMEYMAMKKPVLSNSLPSVVAEIGEDSGVIFAKNQQELIKQISILTTQKAELKQIGIKGYDLIKQKYIWPKILNHLKQIIIRSIKEKRNSKIKG